MAAANKSWPLNKVTNAAHWDAEDLFGRLCIMGDAAFLSSGFLPCDAPETTPWSVSSRYSVPHNGRHLNARRERLPLAAFAPVLSCGMDDAARALTMSSPSPPDDDANGGAPWLWKLFTDQLCRRLFLSICHQSDVPVLPSFVCLPAQLHVADYVATVECASKELRCLVADHDAVLWKARYESIRSLNSHRQQRVEYRSPPIFSNKEPPYFTNEDMPLMSWKERYTMARLQTMVMSSWRFKTTPMPTWKPWVPSAKRAKLQTIIDMVHRRCGQHNSPQHHDHRPEQPRTVVRTSSDHGWRGTTVDDRSSRRTMATVVLCSKPYRKGNGVGAVHSPSSRHRWNHR
ncbi:hypothetical protein SORBI_3010G232800 [Sorghum bicolor]|uniref:Uncharacterized protein n=1 Tax=Sorghum bicolor TaxID=4558 RepID=A0A194YL30_SORBI|nr:hypothetical protein SORBI_3010G232800 [Sorghum bicolor]